MKKLLFLMTALVISATMMAEDHVMAATKSQSKGQSQSPETLSLSLSEAQEYAVQQNRSMRNASLAVQEAYAQRWQTIAAMLPQVDGSIGKTIMYDEDFKEKMISFGSPTPMSMSPWAFGVTASVGINGQAIVGVLLNNIAIEMQKISLEQNEDALRANVKLSYASVLVLQDIVALMDSSLTNLERLAQMTQRSVDVGAAEQTAADQIVVRVNTIRDNINSQKRNVELSIASLKVLLDVPVTTELELTTELSELLSADAVLQLLGENYNKENNLKYQLLKKNVDIAEKNVHMAGWAYGPTVSLAYQYSYRDYGDEEGFSMMNSPHTVAFNVAMPLWSSGKRAAGVVEKKIALEAARNTLAETTDNLDIQYQQLRYTLQNAYESYLTQKANLDVTRRVFESTTNKFNYGSSSNLELINASNDVISAQSSYVQAVLTLVQANVELDKFLNN